MPYLFAHFREKLTPDGEQVHFAKSKNGYDWEKVNDGNPVITCTDGEKGCRDIDVIRLKDNSFVFIATDLCIVNRMDENHNVNWADISSNGSKFISWRSDDLVHFTPQEIKYFGRDDFGCIWAPEIFMTRRQTIILSISAQPSRRTIFKKWQFITPKQRILKASPIQNYFLKKSAVFSILIWLKSTAHITFFIKPLPSR